LPRLLTGPIVIATHNPGKLREMRELLAPYGIEAQSAGELSLAEPEETGTTFRANARIKGKPPRAPPARRRSRTTPASWLRRSAASPASTRRGGPAPTRTSAAP
jgi:hypothetical protein